MRIGREGEGGGEGERGREGGGEEEGQYKQLLVTDS